MPTLVDRRTLTSCEQVGHYDFEAAIDLTRWPRATVLVLKEHNADYLT